MKKQIEHIYVHQTSKVIAAMHTVMITLLFVIPSVLVHVFKHEFITGLAILVLVPLLLWIFLYIGYVIGCWFYNLVVPWTGGIELNVTNVEAPVSPPVSASVLHEDESVPPVAPPKDDPLL